MAGALLWDWKETSCFLGCSIRTGSFHLVCIFPGLLLQNGVAKAEQSHMSLEGWVGEKIAVSKSFYPPSQKSPLHKNAGPKFWSGMENPVFLGHLQWICESHGIYTSRTEPKPWKRFSVNRKLCSAIQMFSSHMLCPLIVLVFPREKSCQHVVPALYFIPVRRLGLCA